MRHVLAFFAAAALAACGQPASVPSDGLRLPDPVVTPAGNTGNPGQTTRTPRTAAPPPTSEGLQATGAIAITRVLP